MSNIPNNINKAHIISAIQEIDNNGISNSRRNATEYALLYNNKEYPPKYVISIANKFANNKELSSNDFNSIQSRTFLTNLGFECIKKSNSLKRDFAKWLLDKGQPSYKQYLGDTIESIEYRLDEINNFFSDKDLFLINKNNFDEVKTYISNVIYGKSRSINEAFFKYNDRNGNGIPQAILGRKNYFIFLDEFNNMSVKHNLKNEFLEVWPEDRVKEMTLEEYTNLNRDDSFCYWLESKTTLLGSIWGGSAYKFGIFKKTKETEASNIRGRQTDGVYGWYSKYGDNKEEAFSKIKEIILKIIYCVKNNYLETIDNIDLGFSYRWKIAFLYGDYNTINIFKYDALKFLAIANSINENQNKPSSTYNRFLLDLKRVTEDYFEFTQKLWDQYEISESTDSSLVKEQKNLFIDYLKKHQLAIEIADELDELSSEVISKGRSRLSIYECLTLEEVHNFSFKSPISENWDNLYEHYFYFVLEQIKLKTGVDLSLRYGLVTANNKEEYYDFIKGNYWNTKNKNVYSQYLNNFRKGDRIALYNYKNRSQRTIYAIGTLIEDINDNIRIKVKWNNNFAPFITPSISETGSLDFYEIEPHLDSEKIEEIENIFYNPITMKEEKIKPLNQILYGPPGTGKTYKTKELAIKIIDNTTHKSRTTLNNRYKELVQQGQIVFTTFHQSMSYEDFVEGIKPKTENNNVTYEVEDGIFKLLSNKAKGVEGSIKTNLNNIDFKNCNYFKMSLGGKNRKDVHDWCIDNSQVALGYGGNNDLNKITSKDWKNYKKEFQDLFPEEVEKSSYSLTATHAFKHWMKEGDVVLVSLGNNIIDAIGVIEGNYEYKESSGFSYHHFRNVRWIATNLNANPSLFVDKKISQQTIYQFNNDDINIDYLENTFTNRNTEEKNSNYVLIIDEINRGNISSIFGELITLLEEDKRLKSRESITAKLPYSKDEFGVPKNLYIIGTMNTADRSVEALDTALRRRFSFTEVAPNYKTLKSKIVEEIELEKLLQTINDRIEILIDKDHKIGHSYFLNIQTLEDLKQTFKNKVIPLLEEYFFGDYGKIGLVLGSSFIKLKEDDSKVSFAKSFTEKYEDAENLREKAVYTFTDEESWEADSFISIYEA